MKIYIAGKITGLDTDEAYAMFTAAEAMLRGMGHEPVNPMDKVSEQENWPWEKYMAEDFVIAYHCDALYMLANWQDSKGARIEHAVAQILEKPIFYQRSEIPLGDKEICL